MRRKIFISYRRADSGAHVQGIAQYLANVFGRKQVVLDVDTISGADFPRTLKKWLSECKVLLVLIGPGWLNDGTIKDADALTIPPIGSGLKFKKRWAAALP
jgi:TIR domain